MKKGYKFSTMQLKERRTRKKGKWSKKAKERQSIRMKARFAEKKKLSGRKSLKDIMNGNGNRITMKDRLINAVAEINAVLTEMG